jgi:hypothetical protein
MIPEMNHPMKKTILIAFASTLMCGAHAQDSLRTDVMYVTKVFKPVLSEAMKIPSNPNPEIPEIKTPVFTYNQEKPEQYSTSPTLYTIKPLVMGTALLPRIKNNYTKLGYGNYNTPLAEIYLNTTRNKSLQAGLFAKHLSSSAGGEKTFSNNTISAFAKKFNPGGVLSADFLYYRNHVNLYATDPNPSKPADLSPLRRTYNLFEGRGSYSNITKDTAAVTYKLGLAFYNQSSAGGLSENNFKLGADLVKNVQGNPLEGFVGMEVIGYNRTIATAEVRSRADSLSLAYQRVYVDANARYTLHMSSVYLKLGFNSTVFSDSTPARIFFYPVAEAGLTLLPGATAFAGISGNLARHTLRSISIENPFLTGLAFRNTNNQFEFYGGVKGRLGPQTSFLVQAGVTRAQNMLFYAVDSAAYNGQVTLYDSASSSVTHVKAEVTHEFADKFRMAIAFNYYNYDISLAQPYSRPTVTAKVNAMYNVSDKFILRTDIFSMNERTALVLGQGITSEQKMKALVDLNFGLDYLYNKNISVFLNLNNVTNNTYQRWYNYPVYGFNVLGGLTFSF